MNGFPCQLIGLDEDGNELFKVTSDLRQIIDQETILKKIMGDVRVVQVCASLIIPQRVGNFDAFAEKRRKKNLEMQPGLVNPRDLKD